MKSFSNALILCLIGFLHSTSVSQSEVDKAYQHLYQVMDRYHTTFDVYTDRDAGGNRFIPTLIGDWWSININDSFFDDHSIDATSIRIDYSAAGHDSLGWASVNWLFPENNWGFWQGHDLSGATRLTFLARGESGGEKVEFLLGGTNRSPDHDTTRPFMDSVDKLSTGIVTLSDEWQEYFIDLTESSYFAVYSDGNAGSNNRYIPAKFRDFGNIDTMIDPDWRNDPYSGTSCIKIEWTGFSDWNGWMWLYPEQNWTGNPSYDLTGATELTFWVKTDEPGLQLKFQVGTRDDSCGEVYIEGTWVEIDTKWRQYTIDLTGKNLTNVGGGFAVAFDRSHDPAPDGTTFYLDDIRFDKPLSKDLYNTIAGFSCGVSRINNPNGCTFYLDNIRYELSDERRSQRLRDPHLLTSYNTTKHDTFDQVLRNTAFLYDNALVLLAFLHGGSEDDLWRADVLANTLIYCQDNDRNFRGRFKDYRLRNGYRSGDLIEPGEGWARSPFYYDDSVSVVREDPFNLGSATGNLAWAIIALLYHHEARQSAASLDAAIRLGEWIRLCRADDSLQGYYGGDEYLGGGGYAKVAWRSSEHNLDLITAFNMLFKATNDSTWYEDELRAIQFISSMYNSDSSYFWIGTTATATDTNRWPLVEDVQTWGMMVLREQSLFPIIDWVKQNCWVSSDGFEGIDFDTDRDGVWFEGTAHAALACWMAGDMVTYDQLIVQLRKAQTQARCADGLGIVAASHDGVTTGLDWKYFERLHIGATAWYIFAETKWNPYWQTYEDSPISAVEAHDFDSLPLAFVLSQNYPNPFNPSTQLRFNLPKGEHVLLNIYSASGQLVCTLLDQPLKAGTHNLAWRGRDDYDNVVSSGLYFAVLRAGDQMASRKLILVR